MNAIVKGVWQVRGMSVNQVDEVARDRRPARPPPDWFSAEFADNHPQDAGLWKYSVNRWSDIQRSVCWPLPSSSSVCVMSWGPTCRCGGRPVTRDLVARGGTASGIS